ncbi:MAG: MarR family transcriptional regulator [Methylomarinum sp.]|nr:MarR family transcriptional regulator [Methylomarinum sp.]
MQELNTFKLIERISTLLRSEERKKYSALGLQPVHGQVLDYLSNCNKHSDTPATVAEFLSLTKGTVSQSIQVLERKGYLEKQQDTEDRRSIHLKLLPSGHDLVAEFKPLDIFQKAEEQVAQQKFSSLGDALKQTLIALQQSNHSKTFGLCNTCSHFAEEDNHYLCHLTKEPLEYPDINKICKEHTLPTEQI